jgi:hypothetical protein
MSQSIQEAVSDITHKVAETLGVSEKVGEEKTKGGVESGTQEGKTIFRLGSG